MECGLKVSFCAIGKLNGEKLDEWRISECTETGGEYRRVDEKEEGRMGDGGGGDDEERVGIIVSERGESMLTTGDDKFSHSRVSNTADGDEDDEDDENIFIIEFGSEQVAVVAIC